MVLNSRSDEAPAQGLEPENVGVVEIGDLQVRDISGVGARLEGFDVSLRAELLSGRVEPPFLRIKPGYDAPMVVEVLNVCAGSSCQLVANATLSRPLESGLRERHQIVVHTPLDGIEYDRHLPELSRSLRVGLSAELRAREATSKQLAAWLTGKDAQFRDAALRAVMARKVVEVGPQIAGLVTSDNERVALLGIAAAGVLATDELLPSLEKAALGTNPNIADAAVLALSDIGNPGALRSLGKIGENAATDSLRARAKKLQAGLRDKLSPTSINSDNNGAR